jgi:hypothetical protein
MGGLENPYSWSKVGAEYRRQIEAIATRAQNGWLTVETAADFAAWYRAQFPGVSPAHSIVERTDWSGDDENVAWYYSPVYRARFVWSPDHAVIEDLRAYDDAGAEPWLTSADGAPTMNVTFPGLLDARDYTVSADRPAIGGTLVGTGPNGDESSGAGIANVQVSSTPSHLDVTFDSSEGHTEISFAPDGFTITRSGGAGPLGEEILVPSAASHDIESSIGSDPSNMPNTGALATRTVNGATASVFLGTGRLGVRGGAAFLLQSVSGSSSAATRAGTNDLVETPMSVSGSGSVSFSLMVAPATSNDWRARIALALQDPSRFR